MVAFESSTAMRRFFGEIEGFELRPGAKRDWSCDAEVVMMSPYLGWCRAGPVAVTIWSEMCCSKARTFHEVLRKTGWSVNPTAAADVYRIRTIISLCFS